MENNSKQPQNITESSIYIAALSATFRPAPDRKHVTHWLSTKEVYDAIKDIDPGCKMSLDDVHYAMIEAGYQYQSRPGASGIDFRWMLQAK